LLGVKSSPAIAGDSLYVGGHDHNMYAINAIDGNLRWSFQAGEAIWAPPLVIKDRLIFGDGDGSLYSLIRETGEPEWHLSLGSPIKVAPTLVNDLLIVRTVDGSVYAIGDCSTPQRGNAPGCLSGQ
jgi:outer membrane protein assembly factor BamB